MTRTDRLLAGIQIGLGALFLVSGLPKVAGVETAVEQFEEYGLPGWFAPITGVFEVFGGAGLWLGFARPLATVVAGLLLMPTMIVGSLLHREHDDDPDALAVPPAVLAGLLGGVTLKSVWQVRERRSDIDAEGSDTDSIDEDGRADDDPATPRIEQAEPPAPDLAYRVINPLMERLLRSPFHGPLSDSLALITFTGRKTGTEYTTPVGYHRLGDDEQLVVFTHSDWWRNLRGGQPVTLRLRGTDQRAIAEPTRNEERVAAYVEAFVAENGIENARRIGLDVVGDRLPEREALKRSLSGTVVIELELLDENGTDGGAVSGTDGGAAGGA